MQGAIAVMQVDLADLASVRALAKAFQASERGPDLLVSAAGSGPGRASALPSLFKSHFAAQYLTAPDCGGLFHAALCLGWRSLSLVGQRNTHTLG
jgi:NAD(P)-dependent dehydrogenase (short-subunit alcohol dehydrogenase family)